MFSYGFDWYYGIDEIFDDICEFGLNPPVTRLGEMIENELYSE